MPFHDESIRRICLRVDSGPLSSPVELLLDAHDHIWRDRDARSNRDRLAACELLWCLALELVHAKVSRELPG